MAAGKVALSRRYAEMPGYAPDEIEQTVTARRKQIHPDDWLRVERVLNEHLTGSTAAYEVEFRLQTKSGEWEWVLDRDFTLTKVNSFLASALFSAVDMEWTALYCESTFM